jgi:hypothetical protein
MMPERRVLILGNTFPVKEQLKAFGGRWVPGDQGWLVPPDKAQEARALVEAARLKRKRL